MHTSIGIYNTVWLTHWNMYLKQLKIQFFGDCHNLKIQLKTVLSIQELLRIKQMLPAYKT